MVRWRRRLAGLAERAPRSRRPCARKQSRGAHPGAWQRLAHCLHRARYARAACAVHPAEAGAPERPRGVPRRHTDRRGKRPDRRSRPDQRARPLCAGDAGSTVQSVAVATGRGARAAYAINPELNDGGRRAVCCPGAGVARMSSPIVQAPRGPARRRDDPPVAHPHQRPDAPVEKLRRHDCSFGQKPAADGSRRPAATAPRRNPSTDIEPRPRSPTDELREVLSAAATVTVMSSDRCG